MNLAFQYQHSSKQATGYFGLWIFFVFVSLFLGVGFFSGLKTFILS